MKSDIPKVLHTIDGKPLITHLLETLSKMDFDKIVLVIGHKGEQVIEQTRDFEVEYVWQKEQLGTGHAVLMAEELFEGYDGDIIVAAEKTRNGYPARYYRRKRRRSRYKKDQGDKQRHFLL